MPVPQVEAAPPCSTTPHPNNSAAVDVAQTRSPAGIVEQPPAAVLAFPMRNSNFARACIASLDVSPAVRITGFAIADCAAVHPRPMKYRHIQAGDCAAYPAGKVIQRKRRGRKVCLRTIRNHINKMVAAGLNRYRTTRTNTYVFTLPEQPQKHPGIRAEIANSCTLFCTPKEPRTESRREDPPPPPARVTAAPRNRCSCGHTWPAEYGDECHECKRADREERRRRRRRDRRDRRRRPLPSNVREQIARTDRSQPIHGCPASARRARIVNLELSLERWRSRTDPAIVQDWQRELEQLTAAAADQIGENLTDSAGSGAPVHGFQEDERCLGKPR